jgi:sulfoxide reductase heme-binding subunit YedZ
MVKRLGGTAWRRLHRLVYLVGILAALHFLWLAKGYRPDAFLYAGILALLLGVRLFDALRRRLRRGQAPVATRPSPV